MIIKEKFQLFILKIKGFNHTSKEQKKRNIYLGFVMLSFITIISSCGKGVIVINREKLHAQAVKESLVPVKPGVPGEFPFWNINSERFMYAPAFDFTEMVAAVINGMLQYARLEPDNAKDALLIARNAAGYLISTSEPEGSPLEFFPPTYNPDHINPEFEYKNDSDLDGAIRNSTRNKGKIMLIYPCSVADAYLNLYNKTIKLAEAVWQKPYKNFDFEGQFEDISPSKRYMNLANGPALDAARHFFNKANEDPSNVAKAEEFLRFAEDQFVVWADPLPRHGSESWFVLPCALEQYECYVPIDAHAAAFISIFYKAYQVTGKELYLAKAISLANSITLAQEASTGRYLTWWMSSHYKTPGWINCAVTSARVMDEFGKEVSKLKIKYIEQKNHEPSTTSTRKNKEDPGGKPVKYIALSTDAEAYFTPRDFENFQGVFTQQIIDVCSKYDIPFTWLIIVDKEHVEVRTIATKVFPRCESIDEFSLHAHFKWFIMDNPDDFKSFKISASGIISLVPIACRELTVSPGTNRRETMYGSLTAGGKLHCSLPAFISTTMKKRLLRLSTKG